MTLGRKIRIRRTELGMTQPELAGAAKLSQGYISKIERDDCIPKETTLIVLAVALKTSQEELMNEVSLMKQQVS